MYQKRFYREYTNNTPLLSQLVCEGESDLQIYSQVDVKQQAYQTLQKHRKELIDYIKLHPEFYTSLEPLATLPNAPLIVEKMAIASNKVGIGPMGAVAGAISEFVGTDLLQKSSEMIIENGGDIFLAASHPKKVLVFAGQSSFSNKLAIEIDPLDTPTGICTSAGTVGHSLSFGNADAVMIISPDTLLADAAATAVGNRVKKPTDIDSTLKFARSIDGITGALIIIQESLGVWGDIKLVTP